MGKIITNRELIAAPPVARLRYGVFTAAQSMLDMDTRIIASGLQFLTDHCDGAQLYDQTCESNPTKTVTTGSDLMAADPYWVVARKRCGSVGRSADEMLAAVRSQLYTASQTLVENAIWDSGSLTTVTPTLTGAGATIVTPLGSGFGAAIAALEQAFYAVNGYIGTIHVSTRAYAAAAYNNLIVGAGGAGRLTTPIGSVWSFGAGYGITGPADVAPGAPENVWAFMTSPVTIWRSGVLPQPDPRQTFDRTLNQWDVVAEEVFAHTWDCPEVFAVEVPVISPGVVAVA
jgi:hypothetical protein